MTLEELELRVRAVFPGCKFLLDEDEEYQCADIALAGPEEILGVVVWGFCADVSEGLLVVDDVDGDFGCGSSFDVTSEIERRILNLTGHREIAIRRRFAGTAS